MSNQPAILQLDAVRFGYARGPEFLGPIDWRVYPGELWGVIGPNGAGKSTLLRLCAGLLTAHAGRTRLAGAELGRQSALERARQMAFLPQRPAVPTWATVREVALLGRFPHRRYRLFESGEDLRVADEALRRTDLTALADRPLDTLSGGEAQRAHLAAALAQQPQVLILDEPTAALDPYHQLRIFSILASQARERNLTVVAATHDLNLAGQFCDRVLLLNEGRVVASGPPEEVLDPAVLGPVYRVAFETAGDGRRRVFPIGDAANVSPDPEART